MPLLISSPSFEDGGIVAPKYSCFGDNVQPGFEFSSAPDGTASYAIVFHDIDVALDGKPEDGLHWVVWNIPAEAAGVPEGGLPDGSVTGRNVENRNAYLGPGAPAGARYHHYVFEVYALDSLLDLPETASRGVLLAAMEGHVIDKAAYVGRFKRAR
ncbi:MAG TPA: YbhB/YbcL family Raf kinase inhibitor-like protein [Gammaproteobacteria bacterium]|nr:YbhB/YbcL family Raf kinase inhibitor-like protein [Gammaproteobacteria bacterium]